jgi:membrane protease YdiL (CAAX protease family)
MGETPTSTETGRAQKRALTVLVLLVPIPSIGVFSAMVWPGGTGGHWVFVLCKIWLLVLPTLWWWRIEGGRPRFVRPEFRPALIGFIVGLGVGAAIWGAWLLGLADRIDPTALREASHAMGLSRPLPFVAATFYWALLNSAVEEYVYRWFLLGQLSHLSSQTVAVFISALVFTAHHVIALWVYLPMGFVVLGSAGVFTGGLIWALLFQRYQSVWPCWISHVLVDFAVFSVGWEMIFGG